MVNLGTLRGLYERRHQVAAYCPSCRHWAVLDLEGMVRAGRGDMPVKALRPRCRRCGREGEKQVRPPVPDFSTGIGQWQSWTADNNPRTAIHRPPDVGRPRPVENDPKRTFCCTAEGDCQQGGPGKPELRVRESASNESCVEAPCFQRYSDW
jgi:hypothetical protein